MASDSCFLGIDVGTSGAKALLIDAVGTVLADALTEYPLSTPRPLWSEQDPEDWWRATVTSIAAIIERAGIASEQIAAVGLTGQMHGLVLLDETGRVLRPAILWNDQRTGAQCDAIHERLGRERVIHITGKPALTGFTASKILWVREHEPEVYAAARRILLPKDYVRYRMTGEFLSDVADASGTNLFDVSRRAWADDLIEALEIPRAWLPEVTESHEPSARVRGESECGLSPGTIVVGGAGDQAAEAIGCGIVAHNDVSVSIGTSGVVFAALDSPDVDPEGKLHAYCHAAPDTWHLMGVMLSAGGSLRWYRDTLAQAEVQRAAREGEEPYDLLLRDAESIAPGCEGLVFLPYLTGERTPHPDPDARGAFVGLTLRHTKAHLTRAVLEGITFGLTDALDLARGLGIRPGRVRVSGGGSRSAMWRQMMADVFAADVVTVNVTQGAAFGAAILASVGAGAHASVPEAASAIVRETSVTTPGPDVERYVEVHACYRALYPALSDAFRNLGST